MRCCGHVLREDVGDTIARQGLPVSIDEDGTVNRHYAAMCHHTVDVTLEIAGHSETTCSLLSCKYLHEATITISRLCAVPRRGHPLAVMRYIVPDIVPTRGHMTSTRESCTDSATT